MAAKPTPGGSDGTYGTELNEFLDVSLASDGKVKDGAVFSTSAAPTVDVGVANKKYVDDTVPVGAAPTLNDSDSNPMLKDHAYQSQTLGMVNAFIVFGAALTAYVDTDDDPVAGGTVVDRSSTAIGGGYNGVSFIVPKFFRFEIVASSGTPTIVWTPLITGSGAPIDKD